MVIKMAILTGIVCIAVYMDLRYYRIPNLCVLIGMAAGLIMTFVSYSAGGVLEVCAAMLMIFAAFYPFYLMGGLGAGDVKLLMMTGCFLYGAQLLRYLLATFIIAAAVSVVKMLLFRECRQRLIYLGGYIKRAALTGNIEQYEINRKNKRCVIRLSVPALIGLLLLYAGLY